MNQLLAFLNQGWVGSLLGIIGIATGYLFFLAARKRKLLRYEIETKILIKNFEYEIDGLQISYHNNPIKNLAVTRVYLWNAGRDVIRKNDIPSTDPISFFVQGSLVGHPKLEFYGLRNRNQFELRHGEHKDRFIVDFSYIDFRDLCRIEFFHTFSDDQKVAVSGSVIGCGRPEKGKYFSTVITVTLLLDFVIGSFALISLMAMFLYVQDRILRLAGIDPANLSLYSPGFTFEKSLRSLVISLPLFAAYVFLLTRLGKFLLRNRFIRAMREKVASLIIRLPL